MPLRKFKINDPVTFYSQRGLENGFIASIRGEIAEIVNEDNEEFRITVYALRLKEGVQPKRVYTRNQLKKAQFSAGDSVYFIDSTQKQVFGTIIRMNPKRARIQIDDEFWDIPYEMLEKHASDSTGTKNRQRLEAIAKHAEELISKHQLDEWRFTFDNATRRCGVCSYTDKIISMSEQFCLYGDHHEITDTILHEIAHALVGSKHGHDSVWQSKAKEIGCKANRTHSLVFTPPNYIMSCQNCGWHLGRHSRRKLSCKVCRTPVQYEIYTPKLWNTYQQHVGDQYIDRN